MSSNHNNIIQLIFSNNQLPKDMSQQVSRLLVCDAVLRGEQFPMS